MRRGGSLSENLRTKFYGSIYQHQFGYTLNLLPSCLKNGGHLYLPVSSLVRLLLRPNSLNPHPPVQTCDGNQNSE